MMNVQTFNNNLVESKKELINFTEYSSDIIKNVFSKNGIFKILEENSEKKGYIIHSSLLEKYCNLRN